MIESVYTSALLAAAAYARWDRPESEIKGELINNRGFTEAQYNTFFESSNPNRLFEVIPNGYIQTLGGFSATAFRNISTGEITVSYRGTDGPLDWDTNIDVVLGVDLIGFLDSQDDSITGFLEAAGLVTGGVLQSGVNFIGHSLGGYLATMASYKYVDTLGSTSTFNGLGVSLYDLLLNGAINGISLDGVVTNYYADIVGEYVGFHPGAKTEIFIGNESALEDHSISKQVESLSVYRVLAKLDPTLDSNSGMAKIYSLLDGASNVASQSLEAITSSLGNLLGGSFATPAVLSDIELFYQAAEGLVESTGTLNIALTGAGHASLASGTSESARGYRYALINLLPFAITSNLTGTAADDTKYDDVYSAKFMADRALMLGAVLQRNVADSEHPLGINGQAIYFEDRLLGTDIFAGQTPLGNVQEADVTHIVFDDDSGHFLNGAKKDDRLYGMGGADTLIGNGGNDYLEGGEGQDTYQFSSSTTGGFGVDTIVDSNGILNIDGEIAFDLTQISAGSNVYAKLNANGTPVNDYLFIKGKHVLHSAA